MKKIHVIALFALIILGGAAGGIWSRTRLVPRAAVDRLLHDFGRVRYGEVARTSFTIQNADDAPLVLGPVRTSCGCTKAELNKFLVPTAENATLAVSFDPAVHKDDTDIGKVERSVYVQTNDPAHEELVFRVRAFVYR